MKSDDGVGAVLGDSREAARARSRGGLEAARSGLEPGGPLPGQARFLLSLQPTAGNRAVTGLVQRWRNASGDPGLLKLSRAGADEALPGISADGVSLFGPAQLKDPRRTEERILGEMTAGTGSLTAANSADLIEKMDKDQSFSRARAIAAQTEAESEQLVGALPPAQQANVRAAIRDYVTSSTAIQADARANPNAPNQAVRALDAALAAIRQQIANNAPANDRIVYRSISYPGGGDIPYGQANAGGNVVNIGDFVGDRGFLRPPSTASSCSARSRPDRSRGC